MSDKMSDKASAVQENILDEIVTELQQLTKLDSSVAFDITRAQWLLDMARMCRQTVLFAASPCASPYPPLVPSLATSDLPNSLSEFLPLLKDILLAFKEQNRIKLADAAVRAKEAGMKDLSAKLQAGLCLKNDP